MQDIIIWCGIIEACGVMYVSRWITGFSTFYQTQSITQVWIRIFNLPLEFRKGHNLFNIAMGVGMPITIVPLALSLYHGLYAKMLVEVDLSKPLLGRILVTKKNKISGINFEFFVHVE